MDLPSYLEANWIASTIVKLLWVTSYMAVYGLRPVIMRPKPIGECHCQTCSSAAYAVEPAFCLVSAIQSHWPGAVSEQSTF